MIFFKLNFLGFLCLFLKKIFEFIGLLEFGLFVREECEVHVHVQAYKTASERGNFRGGIAKVSQGVCKKFPWDNKKVAHKIFLKSMV